MPALFLALVLALISGCSTLPAPPRPAPPPPETGQLSEEARWAERQAVIGTLENWRVRGKVAYRLPDDAGSANLDWQQTGGQSSLRLSGPMGVGSTEIRNEGALLRVKRDGIERLYPADAAPWLSGGQLLPVPVNSIQHWLRGVPDPAIATADLETENALATRIEQNGWVVEYDEYREAQELSPGLALPSRLNLSAPDSGLTLRIILRAWEP
ncbi:lipoprotein insertase outer membrane protein LolB [Congregibacter litoralis]|uniref:Outer-membrane lipoprotein LolB n=1 Tax=Congregibacter litoralis KT71 TaxID=314285 RepID=A4A598_9GAMM|nr:lipoprotein insertase outer membrane protein LolB [Congregibacter litoralis]EAQ98969.1 outer membrane lipoprotein LolB [Congregibacter litoralis KT71]